MRTGGTPKSMNGRPAPPELVSLPMTNNDVFFGFTVIPIRVKNSMTTDKTLSIVPFEPVSHTVSSTKAPEDTDTGPSARPVKVRLLSLPHCTLYPSSRSSTKDRRGSYTTLQWSGASTAPCPKPHSTSKLSHRPKGVTT